MANAINAASLASKYGIDSQAAREIVDTAYAQGLADGSLYGSPRSQTRDATQELRKGKDMYLAAYQQGLSLSAYLEDIDPTQPGDKLDAYQRQLGALGVKTQSSRDYGIIASTIEDLYNARDGAGATMVPEFLRRSWRLGARYGARATQALRFYASNNPVSDVLEPDFLDNAIRATALRPSILDQLIAIEVGIDSDTYKAFYLTEDAASERMVRVEQGADIPSVTLTGGDHSITLKKYGRKIEFPYEVTRRWRLDFVRFHIARMAARAQLDKEQAAVDVIINGDGNSGTGCDSWEIETDLGGTADQIDLKPLLRAASKFEAAQYMPTIALGDEETYAEYLTVDAGTANLLTFLALGSALQSQGGTPELPPLPPIYNRSYMGSKELLLVDGTQSLGRVYENGADIQETARMIERQTDVIVMTETEGYWVVDQNGAHHVDWST